MSHTKGTWIVGNTVGDRHDIFSENIGLCKVYGKNEIELNNNANLISAAPEMLEALEKIAMQISDQGMQDRFALSLSHIETAIKIARGEK